MSQPQRGEIISKVRSALTMGVMNIGVMTIGVMVI